MRRHRPPDAGKQQFVRPRTAAGFAAASRQERVFVSLIFRFVTLIFRFVTPIFRFVTLIFRFCHPELVEG